MNVNEAKVALPEKAKFEARFVEFVSKLEEKLAASSKARFPSLEPVSIEFDPGAKYIRLVRVSGSSKGAYGFVDKSNGDILKAASWRAPAKHARGSIYADDYGLSACNEYSVRYL